MSIAAAAPRRRFTTPARRGPRLVLWVALVMGVVVALLPLRSWVPAAHADATPFEECPVIRVDGTNTTCPETYSPPDLIGPDAYAAATPAQTEALHALEAVAVQQTLTTHRLPESDTDAVRSWARGEAQTALYSLIVKAIKTPQGDRSDRQRQAADWMGSLVDHETNAEAKDAGAQYAKWAGLDLSRYWFLVDRGVSQPDLQSFLATAPAAYDDADTARAKGGWCVYQPPAPYQDQYHGREVQTCDTPCTILCFPPTPSYDELVRWGQAAASYGALTSTGYALTAADMAAASAFAVASTAYASTVAIQSVAMAFTAFIAEYSIPSAAWSAFAASALSAFSAATGVAAAVIVLAAVVTAVLTGIRVTDDATLPGKLASLVVGARDVRNDAALLSDTDEGNATLLSAFVRATLPLPVTQTRCDNGDAQIPVTCLNPPPVPDAQPAAPRFEIRTDGATTVSPTISLPGPEDTTRTVRVSGNWFVQGIGRPGQKVAVVQSLPLSYPGWDGAGRLVWLVQDPAGTTPQFVGYTPHPGSSLDPDTCRADGSCWTADTIKYLGADGRRHEAGFEVTQPASGTPTASPARPVEGGLVRLEANDFAPGNAVGAVTYSWQFRGAGCPSACPWGKAVPGSSVMWAWRTSGTFDVMLTAVDRAGRSATTTFPVTVAPVAPVVAFNDDPTTPSSTGPLHARVPIAFGATIDYAGSEDNVKVVIDWGDGTPPVTSGFGPNIFYLADPHVQIVTARQLPDTTLARLTATHTYSGLSDGSGGPTDYEVSITATNQAGQTSRATATISIIS